MTSTTDNRTTELRRLLDERGIEYQEFHGQAAGSMEPFKRFYIDGRTQAIIETASHTDDVLLTLRCTPEQAIAATLGSGTLTAEQVSKATYAHSIHADCADADWQAIADELNAELGSGTKPCYAADENYKRCKYSVNRGWCDDAPFLVWDDTGHLFITMSGLKTWDVTDDAKKWFAELGSGTCENVAREWEKTSFAHAGTSFCCSECGAHYVDVECYYAGLADKDEEQIRTNFCPNCGCKVVDEC